MKSLFLISLFLAQNALAVDSPARVTCLQALSNLNGSSTVQLEDPNGWPGAHWTLIWNGSSIYRSAPPAATSPKKQIWSSSQYKKNGDGSAPDAMPLQVKNAQVYFIGAQLSKISSIKITDNKAVVVERALMSCEGVSDKVALDGDPKSQGEWKSAAIVSYSARIKIRGLYPQLFNSASPKGTDLQGTTKAK